MNKFFMKKSFYLLSGLFLLFLFSFMLINNKNDNFIQLNNTNELLNESIKKEETFINLVSNNESSPANTNSNGLIIALAIVGGILVLLCIGYVLMFFVFNHFAFIKGKEYRVFKIGKRYDKVRLLKMNFMIVYADEQFVSKEKRNNNLKI